MPTARYDGFAQWYDDMFMRRPGEGSDTRELAVQLLGDGPGELLDVGCGTGFHAHAFEDRAWTMTGVDVSDDMLRLARERGVNVVRADAQDLPFGDGAFD